MNRYTINDFLEEIAGLGRNGEIVTREFLEWLSTVYGDVEIDIIKNSMATYETVLMALATASLVCKWKQLFVQEAALETYRGISAIAEKHGLKPIAEKEEVSVNELASS